MGRPFTYDTDDEAIHRRYSWRHGRFSQPDPWDGSYDLTDPQSFNRYAYVSNDPVNFTDPSGLDPVVMLDGMGGGWSYGPLGVYGGYASGGVAGSRTFAVFRTETGGEESRFAGFAILGGGSGGSGGGFSFGPRDDGKRLIGGDELSDCLKKLLSSFYDFDLDDVTVHHYIPLGPRIANDPDGYTMGYDTYFKKGKYAPSTERGLRLIAHELVHVEQYKRAGGIGSFGKQYIGYYNDNLAKGMSHDDAYRNIPFEKDALNRADQITNAVLAMNNGKSPCPY